MRTRTLVVAGTGAAAAAFLFDPRRGRERRDRIRTTIRTIAGGRGLEPTTPMPENLVPGRSVPPAPGPDVRVVTPPPSLVVPTSFASPPPPHHEPRLVAPTQPIRNESTPAPSNRAADDTEIVREVRTKLNDRRDLGTDELMVDVVNGVAYLSGSLHDQQTFGEVVDLTGQVPGVRRVQSLLHLPDSESITRVLSGRRPDRER
jgi:hypothetical protein